MSTNSDSSDQTIASSETQVRRRTGESPPLEPTPTSDDAPSKEDRRALMRKNHLINSIGEFTESCYQFNFLEGSVMEAKSLQHRYNTWISPCLHELKDVVGSIVDDTLYEEASVQSQSVADYCHEIYSKILAHIDGISHLQGTAQRVTSSVTRPSSELDELKLHTALLPSVPLFEGDVTLFPEFMTSFGHAVHNRKISSVQKLSALRSKLRGTPYKLIEHFGSSVNDYELAYKTLSDYYTGKNRTAAALVTSFLNLQTLEKCELQNLESFYSKSKNLTAAVKNLSLPDLGDFFMFTHIFNRTPIALRDKFIEGMDDFTNTIPTTEALLTFLSEQLTILRARPHVRVNSTALRSPSPSKSNSQNFGVHSRKPFTSHLASQPDRTHNVKCYYCNQKHFLYHCTEFKRSGFQTRLDFANQNELCLVCLSPKHSTISCPSSRKCFKCDARHHFLLHPDHEKSDSRSSTPKITRTRQGQNCSTQVSVVTNTPTTSGFNQEQRSSENQDPSFHCQEAASSARPFSETSKYPTSWYAGSHQEPVYSNVLNLGQLGVTNIQHPLPSKIKSCQKTSAKISVIPTAVVYISTESRNWHQARAILDTGSETNLVSLACAQRVGMHIIQMKSCIAGVGGNTNTQVHGCTCALIQQKYGYPNLLVPFFVVDRVTLDLPSKPLPRSQWSHLENLDLADPQFHYPSPVDIIFSGDILNMINLQEVKPSFRGSPPAQFTSFGWLVSGGYTPPSPSRVQFSNYVQEHVTKVRNLSPHPLNVPSKVDAQWESDQSTPRGQRKTWYGVRRSEKISCVRKLKTGGSFPQVLPSILVLAPASEIIETSSPGNPPEYADLLNLMFRIESVENRPLLTPEEIRAEEIFRKTVIRLPDGRFEVALPFRTEPSSLGDSRTIALKRMKSLEHRLSKSPQARSAYNLFMRDYLDSGHMELAPPLEPNEPHYFLPHHAVHRPDDPPQKIRVVFNASQKTSSNVSLNQILLPGPKLQLDITSVLTKFRLDQFVFLADVKQMFRQISHPKRDRKFLRILWRFDENEPLQEYQLCTVTYGTASAPFLAGRVLRELADSCKQSHPSASEILTTRTYVDDINGGSNDLNTAIRKRLELQDLLSTAQLQLRKWAANDPRLLSGIPDEHLLPAMHSVCLEDSDETSLKVLGLSWHPQSDTFHYVLRPLENVHTKRQLASQIARVYDPLGWLMPLTICARNVFRVVVQNHYGWDDTLPPSVTSEWSRLAQELPTLVHLTIPRLIMTQDQWLIGFADASERAYGAVIYSISYSSDGPSCSIVMSKARMAPIKPLTLPRLELCAAQLLARAMSKTVPAMNVSRDRVLVFSDSEIALSWITAEHAPIWKIFVGNRVADIQEHVRASQWYHVPTKDNPADHVSRGLRPTELMNCPQWWQGPEWLQLPFAHWPVRKIRPAMSNQDVISEARTSIVTSLALTALNYGMESLENRFSSWKTLVHVVAFCIRFREKVRLKRSPQQRSELKSRYQSILLQDKLDKEWWFLNARPPSVSELQKSQDVLIRRAQAQGLGQEIADAQLRRPKLKITRSLALFLDSKGTLRVGGRLRNSQLPDSEKHPALLPSDHPLTRLLIENSHKALYHVGPLSTLHHLRQKFWIINGKNIVRRQLAKCVKCYTIRPRPFQPEMGQLPAERTKVDFPFATTGIDYAGPFPVSIAGLRRNNTLDCYLAIFVCFATKAVHIEVVTDLSTPGFLQAYRRFVSRRGHPSTIWSDNGRNFLGASNELKRVRNLLLNQEHQSITSRESVMHGTTWKFIPPSAPFFGGLWEAAVKQAKRLLKNCLRDQVPTLETFITITTQVEAVLNSRPLTAMSSSPDDLTVLTPAHFLIFRPMTLPPCEPGLDHRTALKDRHRFSQHLLQTFWSRWKREYLLELQNRTKWDTSDRPARIGDLVLVIDDNAPPLSWTMGKIISIYPGTDGITRVADLRTPKGTLSRPVRKLCPLPEEVCGTESSTAGEDVTSPTSSNA